MLSSWRRLLVFFFFAFVCFFGVFEDRVTWGTLELGDPERTVFIVCIYVCVCGYIEPNTYKYTAQLFIVCCESVAVIVNLPLSVAK